MKFINIKKLVSDLGASFFYAIENQMFDVLVIEAYIYKCASKRD
ncbi:hypothetical protein HMPREF0557_01959 [Listeria innocua ATCC 33091]|uniref:Uncharacterized protein n=1 Tax=Listeria innocua ATCC 33091 TaxID=1002366 RepID=A0AB72Z8M1_LISIO|nr:hypothetical protein HMPREF0557_01959 [Listeria innocua ATCC 33091]